MCQGEAVLIPLNACIELRERERVNSVYNTLFYVGSLMKGPFPVVFMVRMSQITIIPFILGSC